MKHNDASKRTLKPKASEYVAKILAWQQETGSSGLPPVWQDKKLSNWVRFQRAQYKRGRLRPDLALALSLLNVVLCVNGHGMLTSQIMQGGTFREI